VLDARVITSVTSMIRLRKSGLSLGSNLGPVTPAEESHRDDPYAELLAAQKKQEEMEGMREARRANREDPVKYGLEYDELGMQVRRHGSRFSLPPHATQPCRRTQLVGGHTKLRAAKAIPMSVQSSGGIREVSVGARMRPQG
jgi:hypothetical protein